MFASSPNSFLQSPFHLSNPSKPTSVKFFKPQISAVYTSTETKTPNFMNLSTSSSSSFYDVLGIPMTASCHEIKTAYRRLARVCHPDVVSMHQKETSTNEFMKIHAAYSTLSDPNKRATYDRDLYSHRNRNYGSSAAVAMAGFSGYSRRNWETDQCW